MIKKSLIAIVLCLSLIGFTIQSKAVVPVLVALGFLDAGGAVTGSGMALITSGILLAPVALEPLIGDRMGTIEIGEDNDANGSIDTSVRFPTTDQTRDRPVANPNLPASKVFDTPSQTIYSCPSSSSTTGECAAYGACHYSRTTTYILNPDGVSCTQTVVNGEPYPAGSNSYGVVAGTNVNTNYPANYICNPIKYTGNPYSGGCVLKSDYVPDCGTGYTLVNGACSLTNPEKVPDGKCDIELSAGAYRAVVGDPDCASTPQNSNVQNGVLYFDAQNPSDSQDVKIAVIPPDMGGGYSGCPYQVCIPIPGLPGHFRIAALTNASMGGQVTTIDVNAGTGVISQASTMPLNGQLLREGQTYTNAAGQVATVQAGQLVVANSAAGTYVQSATNAVAPSSINVSIPTDYARTGEATTAAKSITDKLDLDENMANLEPPVIPPNPLIAALQPWRDWTPPVIAGVCPSGSFVVFNTSYNFDVACQLLESKASVIQSAMYLFFVVLAIFILLGA